MSNNDLIVPEQQKTTEMAVVEKVDQPTNLPDYAILNPEIPMGIKVEVATKVADTLAPLVRGQGLAIKGLNKKNPEAEYVTVEGWEVLGTFLGIVPVTTIIEDIKNKHDHTVGYKARATLYQNPIIKNDEIVGGTVISRAEAQADKSGWQKDLFAIASMAQTRALGKAYRMGLSWIMKMAGFEGTPAEEMPKYSEGDMLEAKDNAEMEQRKKEKAIVPEKVVDVEAEEVIEPEGFETADNVEPLEVNPVIVTYAKNVAMELAKRGLKINKRSMELKAKGCIKKGEIPEEYEAELLGYIYVNCPDGG